MGIRSLLTLTDSSVKMNLIMLAIPMFFQRIFILLLGTVNTIVLTNVSGDAVTAVNVTNTVLNIPYTILEIPSTGAVIIFSIILGRGEKKITGAVYKTGLIINIISSLLGGVGLLCFAPRLLSMMNISGIIVNGVNALLSVMVVNNIIFPDNKIIECGAIPHFV